MDPVELSLEGPRQQRRWTIALRALLAIPQWLWLVVLVLVATGAIIVGWCCALVLGRLPRGIAEFLTRILRYMARTMAYAQYLLTDRYPPFSLQADGYPVELELPPPGKLNRAAVLFRAILLIPAGFVSSFAGGGLTISLVFIWLIVLVAGRMPRSLFEAITAVLRYQLRFMAYAGMLTSTYPGGLFGDAPPAFDDVPLDPQEDEPAPLPPLTGTEPRITRLVLSKGARAIVALFLVAGVLGNLGSNAINFARVRDTNSTLSRLNDFDDELAATLDRLGQESQTCAVRGGVDCVHAAVSRAAEGVDRYRDQLASLHVPAGSLSELDQLDQDASRLAATLRVMATTDDADAYDLALTQFQRQLEDFDDAEADLRASLLGGGV